MTFFRQVLINVLFGLGTEVLSYIIFPFVFEAKRSAFHQTVPLLWHYLTEGGENSKACWF